jgi:hypothetical protein
MRTILIFSSLMAVSVEIFAQNDFKSLDQKINEFFVNGDYMSLKRTADKMISGGMDYYYLRIRLGRAAYDNGYYSTAAENFEKAVQFNSLDTVSREYIYYSYLLAGRYSDANLYLHSLPDDKKNHFLKNIQKPLSASVFAGTGLTGYDYLTYSKNKLYYEAIKNWFAFNIGVEANFLDRMKGILMYTNFRKSGRMYSAIDSTGKDFNFTQNQFYGKLSCYLFPGWEFSGFGHVAFYIENIPYGRPPFENSMTALKTDYTAGMGISKSGWKVRSGVNFSFSNFGNSNQLRSEGYLTIMPYGNLNLYSTTGGMLQYDKNWGYTYQVDETVGFKITRSLWLETGIMFGNSFLYSRDNGYYINNSFLIPSASIYCNLVIMKWKNYKLNISPIFSENKNYSWNLNALYRTNELNPRSFGITIKLTYKNN